MKSTFEKWVDGLAASVVSSVSTTILASGLCATTGAALSWHQLGLISASSALAGAAVYLRVKPTPDTDLSDTTQVTQTTTVVTPKGVSPSTVEVPSVTVTPSDKAP